MSKPARRRKYANPATSRGRTFVPARGANVEGDFYMGGEAVPAPLAQRAGLPAHSSREQALSDFVERPSPLKAGMGNVPAYGEADLPWADLPWADEQAEFRPNLTGRDMLGHLAEFLSDDEARVLTPANAEALVEVYNQLAPSAEFATGAKMGRRMRGWYRQTGNALQDIFGEDAPRFAALLAATSPRTSVDRNLSQAINLWASYEKARNGLGRELNQDEVRAWLSGPVADEVGTVMRTYHPNIIRALTKPGATDPGHLSGPKVDSFAGNVIYRDPWRVTNDTWQALFGGVPQADLEGVSGRRDDYGKSPLGLVGGPYAALNIKARQAAQALNREQGPEATPWKPLEIQESTWSLARAVAHALGAPRLAATQGKQGGDILDPEQALSRMTHQDVSGNVSFAGLLNQPQFRALLEGMGRDRGLQRALATQANEADAFPAPTGPVTRGLQGRELDMARRIARRLAMGTNSMAIPTAKYSAKTRKPYPPGPQPLSEPVQVGRTDTNAIYDHERELLEELSQDVDPDVAAMAEAALQGDTRALVMLHDALIDAGFAEDGPEVAGVADIATYGLTSHGRNSHMPSLERRQDANWKYNVYNSQDMVGVDPQERIEARQKAILPNNREVMGEALANLPRGQQPTGRQSLSRQGRKRRYQFNQAQPQGMVAASENKESDLGFDDALAKSQSADQKAFRQSIDQVIAQAGLTGKSLNAVGDWEDGAEHSILHFSPPSDIDRLRYAGAWAGLLGNQRSVLVFNPGQQGLDSVYDLEVPERDLRKVRQQLSSAGIPFRTLVPGRKGTRVVVYDEKRGLRDKVAKFAGAYGAPIRESVGSGEYVGGTSRTAARARYREIIAQFEARHGTKGRQAAKAGAPGSGLQAG